MMSDLTSVRLLLSRGEDRAAYGAHKGVDRFDRSLLRTAALPLSGAAAISVCLSAYELRIRASFSFAYAVLRGQRIAVQALEPRTVRFHRQVGPNRSCTCGSPE